MIGWNFPSLELYLNGCTLQNLNDSFDQFESVNYSLSLHTFLFDISKSRKLICIFCCQFKGQRKSRPRFG